MKRLLIIDDEQEMLTSMRKILSRRKDLKPDFFQDAEQALTAFHTRPYDLVITDLKMKKLSGMDVLKEIKKESPEAKVIIISGYGTIESSVEAMRNGAADFLEKPFTAQRLFECIDQALEHQSRSVDKNQEDESEFPGIIYKSAAMERVLQTVRKIADSNLCVLITGESGTGKELIARAIHSLSSRHMHPFVPVNCGALPENLFESELFGHERGAFTGAMRDKPGLMEFADKGTFFLDEIGELGMNMQVKLLRVLEERRIRRVGGNKEIEIDVRIVAATNKNLEHLTEKGLFREDLYYRLTTMKIDIPPLRERTEDIPVLAEFFLNEICRQNNHSRCYFSEDAMKQLQTYSWPGNVRELQNIINRAFYLRTSERITEDDLPLAICKDRSVLNEQVYNQPYAAAKQAILEKFEVNYIKHHLKRNNGNISKTAASCGLDRRTIHRLIKKYQIVFKD